MICPTCKGGKTILKKEQGKGCYEVVIGICDRCHGTGEVEMTNEEFIRQASTEELAKEIYRLVWLENELFHRLELVEDFGRKKDLEIVTEWLKEIRK